MGKRQDCALKTKSRIVEAMRLLLQEKPADAINIEDITTKAGVAKGSFYTHFKRKEDVFSVLAMEQYDVVKNAVIKSGWSVQKKISRYLRDSAEIIEKTTLQIAQNWMKSVTAPLASETGGAEKYHYDRSTILAILQKAVDKNELKAETPVESLKQNIIDTYYGAVAVWCITNGEETLNDGINDFCVNALSIILENYKN